MAPSDETPEHSASSSSLLRSAVRWLVTLGLIGWLSQKVQWGEVAQKLVAAQPGWIAAALGVMLLSQAASAARWRLLSGACGLESRYGRMLSLYFEGMFASLCLPSTVGGDLMKIVRLGGKQHKTLAAATVLADRVAGFVALLALLGVALVMDSHQPVALRRSAAGVVAIGLGAVVAVAIAAQIPALRRLMAHRILRPLALLNKSPWLRILWWGFVVQSLCVVTAGCLTKALGLNISVATIAIATLLTGVASALPISFSGIGLRETIMPTLLAAEGVPKDSGVAVGVWLTVIFLVSGLLGGFAHLHEQHRAGRQAKPAKGA